MLKLDIDMIFFVERELGGGGIGEKDFSCLRQISYPSYLFVSGLVHG
jgi:hypothetical protein